MWHKFLSTSGVDKSQGKVSTMEKKIDSYIPFNYRMMDEDKSCMAE